MLLSQLKTLLNVRSRAVLIDPETGSPVAEFIPDLTEITPTHCYGSIWEGQLRRINPALERHDTLSLNVLGITVQRFDIHVVASTDGQTFIVGHAKPERKTK